MCEIKLTFKTLVIFIFFNFVTSEKKIIASLQIKLSFKRIQCDMMHLIYAEDKTIHTP